MIPPREQFRFTMEIVIAAKTRKDAQRMALEIEHRLNNPPTPEAAFTLLPGTARMTP